MSENSRSDASLKTGAESISVLMEIVISNLDTNRRLCSREFFEVDSTMSRLKRYFSN